MTEISSPSQEGALVRQPNRDEKSEMTSSVVPYDENLLERARTQWQFGDWHSLARLDRNTLQHHPDRPKLALFAAAGRLQIGDVADAKSFIRLAMDWGCSKKMVSQILAAGVHIRLGRAAALCGWKQRAVHNFDSCVSVAFPSSDIKLISKALMNEQYVSLGVSSANISDKHNIKKILVPRIIVINGMMRSGSTVLLNIVTDLLEASSVSYIKYYISDFDNLSKLLDHIQENKNLVFVLKTHFVSKDLSDIVTKFNGKYIYSKRNLYDVAASYVRMTMNKESPMYRDSPVEIDQLLSILSNHVKEYKKKSCLNPLLSVNCSDFSDAKINFAVRKIAYYLGLEIQDEIILHIANNRMQFKNAEMVSRIREDDCTSLGHDSETFFHKNHVVLGGTPVSLYICDEWLHKIHVRFSDIIRCDGEFIE